MKIAVIYDGTPLPMIDSPLKEALDISMDVKAISTVLRKHGMTVEILPLHSPLDLVLRQLQNLNADLVFNLFEGFGEDSASEYQLASLLEWMKIPYTGSGPLCLALCHNKAIANGILRFSNIPAPECRLIQKGEVLTQEPLAFPVIVKPVHEDASIGIDLHSVTYTLQELNLAAKKIHQRHHQAAIAEKFIDGREFNVSLLGNSDFDFVQIREIEYVNVEGPKILTYNAKWNLNSIEYQNTKPKEVQVGTETFIEEMKRLSMECFNRFNMRDYGRIDFRFADNARPYVIDVNPNPCISRDSGLTHAAKINHLSYEDFIQRIVDHALERSR